VRDFAFSAYVADTGLQPPHPPDTSFDGTAATWLAGALPRVQEGVLGMVARPIAAAADR